MWVSVAVLIGAGAPLVCARPLLLRPFGIALHANWWAAHQQQQLHQHAPRRATGRGSNAPSRYVCIHFYLPETTACLNTTTTATTSPRQTGPGLTGLLSQFHALTLVVN